jgi:protein-L-isoaspartate(D-aspartate) O-methyltransferase
MADFTAQRFNMVETQVRTNDVTDPRIHAALMAIPREKFLPTQRRATAYADTCVEVVPGRYLLDPRCFAKLLQLAAIQPDAKVLDVGCASGYSAAVLAQLAGKVVALEQDADLLRTASDLLSSVGAQNVSVVQGALVDGVKGQGPYDAIVIEGAVEDVPEALLAQLADNGRLVAVIQKNAAGRAHIYVRENGRTGARPDFDASVPLLSGFRKTVGFVF